MPYRAGIVNLEAEPGHGRQRSRIACGKVVAPMRIARRLSVVHEVVEHGETGLLVTPEAISATEVEPRNPEQFSRDLATAVNVLLDDPATRASMAAKARERVERQFSWASIARQTLEFYEELIAGRA